MSNSKTHFIFRIARSDKNRLEYLTEDRKHFSEHIDDVLMMTEAEASNNCVEYDSEEWIGACGSK